MPELKTFAEIEAAFDAALAEIQGAIARPRSGSLRTKGLERRRQLGTLRLSLSSVAEQAGQARRLIASASPDNPYAAVRGRILEAIGPKAKGPTLRQQIDDLRVRCAALQQQVRARDSRNLELIDLIEQQRIQAKLVLQSEERLASRSEGSAEEDDEDDPEEI